MSMHRLGLNAVLRVKSNKSSVGCERENITRFIWQQTADRVDSFS